MSHLKIFFLKDFFFAISVYKMFLEETSYMDMFKLSS